MFDNNGKALLPVIYDYINIPLNDRLFIVFKGNFKWDDEDDEDIVDLFYDLISDPKSWNGDIYKGMLKDGFWGAVNARNETVIPIIYRSLHFHSDSVLIANENGSRIIKWYHGDNKTTEWSVIGGNWKAMTADGKILAEVHSREQEFDFHNKLNQMDAWDPKYRNQTIGAYFKKSGA